MEPKTFPTILLIILLLSGCGALRNEASSKPEWIDRPAAAYPTKTHIVGTGVGASLAIAQDRARAELAKNFSVNIRARMQDKQSYLHQSGLSEFSSETEQQIETHTEVVLNAVQIVDSWQDPQTQQYHALAALSRIQALQLFRGRIHSLDAETKTQLKNVSLYQDKLSQVGFIQSAIELQRQRNQIQLMLQVVDPSGHGVTSQYSIAELNKQSNQIASNIRIQVQAQSPSAEAFVSSAANSLTKVGIITTDRSHADYILLLDWPQPQLEQRQGWYWYQGNFKFSLKDTNGQIYGHSEWPIKQSATSAVTAATRIHNEVHDKIEKELGESILSFGQKSH
ncbi:MAG TPA: hypothetical protein DCZ03_10005 [Gammaproteobacteria bacterium]|nr:hypothetical protein [Gammaproteobacteria bacterium]